MRPLLEEEDVEYRINCNRLIGNWSYTAYGLGDEVWTELAIPTELDGIPSGPADAIDDIMRRIIVRWRRGE